MKGRKEESKGAWRYVNVESNILSKRDSNPPFYRHTAEKRRDLVIVLLASGLNQYLCLHQRMEDRALAGYQGFSCLPGMIKKCQSIGFGPGFEVHIHITKQ